MSYCRKGKDSDVYVIHDGSKYLCIVCALLDGQYADFECDTPGEMYGHMLKHVMRGHRVPVSSQARLMREELIDQNSLKLARRLSASQMLFQALHNKLWLDNFLEETIAFQPGDGYDQEFFDT